MHGCGDGSYGAVATQDYTNHLDYLKSKVDSGDLWVAPPSQVIKYKHARTACGTPQVSGNTISFATVSSECTQFATEISVIVTANVTTLWARQGQKKLEVVSRGGQFMISIDPTLGDVTVTGN